MNSTREAEDLLVAAALNAVGVEVDSVYDLVNSRKSYRQAFPVLLEILPKLRDDIIRDGVVRALAEKGAGEEVGRTMIAEFKAIQPDEGGSRKLLKWSIGNTLSVVATDAVFEDISALARDTRHGKAREMVALALGNMKDPRAVDILIELLNDDEVMGHAIMALGKLKAKKAEKTIQKFASHPKEWVRKEAERALKKIAKTR